MPKSDITSLVPPQMQLKRGKGNEEQAMKPFTFSFDHCDLQKDKQTNKQK